MDCQTVHLILLMIISYNIHLNGRLFGALLCSVLVIYKIKSSLIVEPLIWNCLCKTLYSLHGIDLMDYLLVFLTRLHSGAYALGYVSCE